MNIDNLHAVETKYDLLNKEINGFKYWTYCRTEIESIYVNPHLYGAGYHNTRTFNLKNITIDFLSIVFNTISNGFIKHKNSNIIFFNHERRVWTGCNYECIYTDDLVKYYNALAIERTYLHRHLKPISTQNILYTDKMEVTSNLWALYNIKIKHKGFKRILEQLSNELGQAIKDIESLEQISLNTNDIYMFIIKQYYIYQSKKKYFDKLIRIIKPKLVIEVVSYNMDCMIMNELAYKYQYNTIELQHGTIGKNHVAYNYPLNTDKVEQLPQTILAFSNYFFKNVYLPNVKICEVGYPYLEKMKQKYPAIRHSIKTILFISQPTTGKLLSEVAVKLSDYIHNNKIRLRIIFRLHPGELLDWENKYSNLKDTDIEIADEMKSIYEYFSVSDFQIGTSSTALFEGMIYNLNTLVLNSYEVCYLKELCDNDFAVLVNGHLDIIDAIENSWKFKEINFWRNGSLETIKKYINNSEAIQNA